MVEFTEGNLKISFPSSMKAEKFDDPKSHCLTHCMKAVDFIAEKADSTLFIELKDPDHPQAKEENKNIFIKDFLSGALNEELKYKYRDTFLYRWAQRRSRKPIFYCVIIALGTLNEAQLYSRTKDLQQKLPLNELSSGRWKRPIVSSCMVFNIQTWNKYQPDIPLSRIV